MFRRYFSDFYKWNITVAIVFGGAYAFMISWGGSWGKYWLIPACYLIVLSLSMQYFVLFFTAIKDLKRKRIEEAAILVQGVVRDKEYNYINRGGAMVGSEKCLLTDADGFRYRVVSGPDLIVAMRPAEHYTGAQVVVRYLSASRIVLSMRLQPVKPSDGPTHHLYMDFQEYFQSETLS